MISTDHYIDLADGQFYKTTPDNLTAAFDALEKSKKTTLVVHFHGGLVSRANAQRSAENALKPAYDATGAYPFFFFWRSDALTTLTRNLDEIVLEDIFQRLVRRLVQLGAGIIAPNAGGRGAQSAPPLAQVPEEIEALARYAASVDEKAGQTRAQIPEVLPAGDRDAVATEIELDPVIQTELAAILAGRMSATELNSARRSGVSAVAPKQTLMSEDVLNNLVGNGGNGGDRGLVSGTKFAFKVAMILAKVVMRYHRNTDHGLLITVMEEVLRSLYAAGIGAKVWGAMKKDTADAFGSDPRIHGGTAFVNHLTHWMGGDPARHVVLVGHSTGAIYILNFLKHAPDTRYRVAFLMPACTFALTKASLPLLAARTEAIRMYGLKDEVERSYWEVPVLYPASLLYMVSGLFEPDSEDTAILGMQRYHSGAAPYHGADFLEVRDFFHGKIAWSKQTGAADGWNTESVKHGGFDSDASTLKSLASFIRQPW